MTSGGGHPPPLIELALAYYRQPLRYPRLGQVEEPLPAGFAPLLPAFGQALAASRIEATAATLGVSGEELVAAARFFARHALLAPGASPWRVLGLEGAVSPAQARQHYQVLIRLFHPDRRGPDTLGLEAQADTADAMRINAAHEQVRHWLGDHPEVADPVLAPADREPEALRHFFQPREWAGGSTEDGLGLGLGKGEGQVRGKGHGKGHGKGQGNYPVPESQGALRRRVSPPLWLGGLALLVLAVGGVLWILREPPALLKVATGGDKADQALSSEVSPRRHALTPQAPQPAYLTQPLLGTPAPPKPAVSPSSQAQRAATAESEAKARTEAEAQTNAEAKRMAEEHRLAEARRLAEEQARREEMARQEMARQEAERLEAARQTAERQEAKRLEAERRETERQEAARLAAAREEAEQLTARREAEVRRMAEREAEAQARLVAEREALERQFAAERLAHQQELEAQRLAQERKLAEERQALLAEAEAKVAAEAKAKQQAKEAERQAQQAKAEAEAKAKQLAREAERQAQQAKAEAEAREKALKQAQEAERQALAAKAAAEAKAQKLAEEASRQAQEAKTKQPAPPSGEKSPPPPPDPTKVVHRLTSAYAAGALDALVGLFTPDAKTTDGQGRKFIRADYQNLFATTSRREINISGLRWKEGKEGRAVGTGALTVRAVTHGSKVWQQAKGRISLELVPWEGDWRIARMEYQLQ